jgi:hypothetical protein
VTCLSPIKFMWVLLMAGKRPNGVSHTGAADKEHKYESTIRSCGLLPNFDHRGAIGFGRRPGAGWKWLG